MLARSPIDESGRLAAIDYVKAAAIVAVVVNHSLLTLWNPEATAVDNIVRRAVQFHVPAFLVVSGYLYARTGLSKRRIVARRLVRILVPYVVASAVVHVTGFAGATRLRDIAFEFVTGSALPIYYYVFLLIVCIVATSALCAVGDRAIAPAVVIVWLYPVAAALIPALRFDNGFFWGMRNPAYYYGYFLAGWVAWVHRPRLRALATRRRGAVVVTCLLGIAGYALLWGLAAAAPPLPVQVLFRGIYTFSVVGLTASLTANATVPGPVGFLSRASYGIYLYHYPFLVLTWPHVTGF